MQLVAMINVVIDQRRQQVVGRRDGVEVAGEVQVDLFHRDHLRQATAGRASLDAEAWPERRLTHGDRRFLADLAQGVGQADRRCGLAFARRGRVDRGDEDQFALTPALAGAFDELRVDLRDRLAIGDQRVGGDADALGDGGDRFRCLRARDFDVGEHRQSSSTLRDGRCRARLLRSALPRFRREGQGDKRR